MQRSDAVRRGAVFEMRGSSVPNLTQPPKVLRSFQNKSQIVTAPPVVIMIYRSAYHRFSRAQMEAKHAKLRQYPTQRQGVHMIRHGRTRSPTWPNATHPPRTATMQNH